MKKFTLPELSPDFPDVPAQKEMKKRLDSCKHVFRRSNIPAKNRNERKLIVYCITCLKFYDFLEDK